MINCTSLRKFDLFQIYVPISYKNSYTYKSNLGGMLTIISFLIIIIYSLIKLSILFDRTTFTIQMNEYHDLGGTVNLTSTPILLQVFDKTGNSMEYDTKLFSFSASYIHTAYENVNGEVKRRYKQTILEIERCDKLRKFIPDLDNFSGYNLTKFMCIKPNQSLILYGLMDSINSNYKILKITIDKCKGNNCYNSKIIEDKMEYSIMTISILGYSTDFRSNIITKNLVNKIYTKYITLSNSLVKKLTYGFDKCKLILYDNMVINNKIEYNYFNYQDLDEDYFIQNKNDSLYSLAYFYFTYSGSLVEYTKKINGLWSIILNICTILNTIVLIGRNINNYYGNKILFSDIYLNFLMKNGRLPKLPKIFDKKEKNASIDEILNKSVSNNIISGIKRNINNANNINLFNCRNYNSLKKVNFLSNNKTNKKQFDFRISTSDIFKFYLYPYCSMKKNKRLYQIKEQINIIFSIENFYEFLKLSNSSLSILNELIFKYISNENYGKSVSKDNELRSDINLKSLKSLNRNNNELHLEYSDLK